MKFVISRYEQDIEWLKNYTEDWIIYDRSTVPIKDHRVIITKNRGSDIYDKFTFIIDNYDHLPEVAIYTKANLFKYISKEEFDVVKDNKIYTPLLTQHHKTYMPVCYYEDSLYWEINNFWYLNENPTKNKQSFQELKCLLKMECREYNAFAPGSSYILTKDNILKHPKSFYEKLITFLEWSVYPGEAFMMERSLHYIWGTDTIGGICQHNYKTR